MKIVQYYHMNKICYYFLCLIISGITACSSENKDEKIPVATKTDSTVQSNSVASMIIVSNDKGGFDTILDHHAKFHESVKIYALDSLEISGFYYHVSDTATSILLCHQAGWNKFEYDSIAVVLQSKGYNCLAIDQRSGGLMGEKNERINQTQIRALETDLPTDYLDAEQDIIASMRYLYNKHKKPIILWGSSYSSTLALYNGIKNDSVAAVIAFSPGDYFKKEKGSLVPILKNTEKPFFLTSSSEESAELGKLIKGKKLNKLQVHFVPKGKGYHGSRALWAKNPGNEEYWQAINAFLNNF